jgi:hypothetical protein
MRPALAIQPEESQQRLGKTGTILQLVFFASIVNLHSLCGLCAEPKTVGGIVILWTANALRPLRGEEPRQRHRHSAVGASVSKVCWHISKATFHCLFGSQALR